jgi:hypothetical protein
MMQDRRSAPRYEVRIDAKIFSPDMSFCADCIIRDLSETGALVSTVVAAQLPPRVYLWESKSNSLIECEPRWQKNNKLFGLRMIDGSDRTRRAALIEQYSNTKQRAFGKLRSDGQQTM